MRGLVLFYCLSGFVSLGYQVVWFRIYTERFGSTNLTFVLVLTNFIAGLGFGALASRAVSDRLQAWFRLHGNLRCYGVVELLIALSVGLTIVAGLVPNDVWGAFPYRLVDGIYRPELGVKLAQVIGAMLCVFIPAFLMGVTFPLLCHLFPHDQHFPSRLYAWNTLGACTGVLVCHLVLLPTLGHSYAFGLLIALNVLIGVYFTRADSAWAARLATAQLDATTPTHGDSGSPDPGTLIALGALGGLLTGALEGDLFKRMWFLGASSGSAMVFISFWAILAIFLASATVSRFRALNLRHIQVAVTLAAIGYALLAKSAYVIRDVFLGAYRSSYVGDLPNALLEPEIAFAVLSDPSFTLVFVGLFTFPVLYLIALLLPYVCNAAQNDKRTLDLTYGANTLAFCIGMVVFTWAAPRVSVFYSLKLIVVLLLTGAAVLWTFSKQRRLPRWSLALGALAMLGAGVLLHKGFDRDLLDPRMNAYHFPVRGLKSNGAHTTYVVSLPEGDALYFDSHPMSGTSMGSQTYMRLMAHFPLLAQDDPRRALLIGFGVGNTAAAIAAHSSVRQVDVLDLNDKVIETAPEFAATNSAVYDDVRVRFIHDDGRTFLSRNVEPYDLITSEPPPPGQDGVYRLYSQEYYEDALSHLTEQGMLSQWLPIDQLSRQSTSLMVATFVRVFPHVMLFSGHGRQLILVGSPSAIDLGRLVHRFHAERAVVADLQRLDIRGPVDLLARIVQDDTSLRRDFEDGPTISDERNDLAYLPADPLGAAAIHYRPMELRNAFAALNPEMQATLESLLLAPGRLHYRVPDFPFRWLAIESGSNADSTDIDWQRFAILQAHYEQATDKTQALSLLERMLAIAPDHPGLLLAVASHHRLRGDYPAAIENLQRFRVLEPADTAGILAFGATFLALGQSQRALDLADEGLALDQSSAPLQTLKAAALEDSDQPLAALAAYDRAIALDPGYVNALQGKAALLERLRTSLGSQNTD